MSRHKNHGALALAALVALSACVATPSPVPPGWEVDATGACYPADITFTPTKGPHWGLARSASAGVEREVIINRVAAPAALDPFKRDLCAFTLTDLGPVARVIVNQAGDFEKHELGHALGLTRHHCLPVTFKGCNHE